MLFMNDYDLDMARRRFTAAACPNRLGLVMVVDALREWADTVSDGWAHWPKPANGAKRAMELIESRRHEENRGQEKHDITHQQVLEAVRPIRSFLTRQDVTLEWRERILRGAEEIRS